MERQAGERPNASCEPVPARRRIRYKFLFVGSQTHRTLRHCSTHCIAPHATCAEHSERGQVRACGRCLSRAPDSPQSPPAARRLTASLRPPQACPSDASASDCATAGRLQDTTTITTTRRDLHDAANGQRGQWQQGEPPINAPLPHHHARCLQPKRATTQPACVRGGGGSWLGAYMYNISGLVRLLADSIRSPGIIPKKHQTMVFFSFCLDAAQYTQHPCPAPGHAWALREGARRPPSTSRSESNDTIDGFIHTKTMSPVVIESLGHAQGLQSPLAQSGHGHHSARLHCGHS